jgi:hypothetical protein
MKSIKFLIYFLIFGFLASCQEETIHIPISKIVVTVTMPDGIKPELKFAKRLVTLRSERMIYTATTDDNGKAEFADIIPDIYNLYASWELSGQEYVQMADTIVENKAALISGIKSKMMVFSEINIELNTDLSIKQSLLISKVYASGTRDINNARYEADPYVEIFNNSDEDQYVDGLYLALVEGDSPMGFPASLNPATLHARQVYRFPGNGTDYKILPGKSIIIANSARNHTFIAPTSVDLQNSDFEFKGVKYPNNDNVIGMIQIYTAYIAIKEINLQRGGVNSLCLFSTTDNVANYPLDYIPGKTSGNMFMRLPNTSVMDGVEILTYKTTGVDINAKRLQHFIDAGYMTISATGGLNHESVERKIDTQKSIGGRIYLIDTNNSQNDLINLTDPTPKKYDKPLLNQ